MDFQPRMGSITRTLEAATPDLTHFFIMFSVFYFGFAMYGHLVFGRTLDKVESLFILVPLQWSVFFILKCSDCAVPDPSNFPSDMFLVHIER